MGNLQEAAQHYIDALRILHESFGDTDHPLRAQALTGQAEVEARFGHTKEARANLLRASSMQHRIYGDAAAPDMLATQRDLAALPAE